MDFTLKIWRQKNAKAKGKFETYKVTGISESSSFLEMLDVFNDQLVMKGQDPVVFDHDCREGICGACSLYINGRPHGPDDAVTTCQLHMRRFKDGDTITIEPWRSAAFPVIRDLMVEHRTYLPSAGIEAGAAGPGYSLGRGGLNALSRPRRRRATDAWDAGADCVRSARWRSAGCAGLSQN